MIDTDVLYSPAFIILSLGAIVATIMGYVMGLRSDMEVFSIPVLITIIAGEVAASYYFAAQG